MDREAKPRWGIWVDVEGFGKLWSGDNLALRGLRHLTSMVYAVGTKCYPNPPQRLFAHQIGDAFYIASDFHEASLDRCAAIATVLMRGMTAAGCVARASIAEGDLGDYAGCRPPEVTAAIEQEDGKAFARLGAGIMTLQENMGQGLIDAVALDKGADTKGALLLVAARARGRLSPGFVTRPLDRRADILAIDWVHSQSDLIDEVAACAGHGSEDPATLRDRLAAYAKWHEPPKEWCEQTSRFAGM